MSVKKISTVFAFVALLTIGVTMTFGMMSDAKAEGFESWGYFGWFFVMG